MWGKSQNRSVGAPPAFIPDRLAEVGAAYRTVMGKHFAAMTLAEAAALLEPRAKAEFETTADFPLNSYE